MGRRGALGRRQVIVQTLLWPGVAVAEAATGGLIAPASGVMNLMGLGLSSGGGG